MTPSLGSQDELSTKIQHGGLLVPFITRPRITPYLAQHCTLCGSEVYGQLALCSGCKADLPWIESSCRTCGLPLAAGANALQCGGCLMGATPFTLAITPLYYRKPLSGLITGFKHRQQLIHGQLLSQLLAQEILDHYLLTGGRDKPAREVMPEVIIPVPLHWQRFLWRGYNQSAELGKHLGNILDIPCRHHFIKRGRRTPSQQGLSREQRLRNLKTAFQLKQMIPFKRIALLDDVVTTGATTTEIARLLLQHGASEIHLWAIARTPATNSG